MRASRYVLGAAALAAAVWMPAQAQEAGGESIRIDLGEISVIGTRVRNVAQGDLAVPVDVYDVEEITATGTTDLSVALQKAAPSFNSKRNSGGDGGLFHSAVLRGISPDHTLVLINGKRRHSISFPRPLDGAEHGTTGVDLRAIPVAAIERIEVLRDGAASQYGSDAIGGVINIVLRENADESTAAIYSGVTQEGDGKRVGAEANVGILVGVDGALNITAEGYDQGRIDRTFDTSHLDVAGPHDPPIGRQTIMGVPEYDARSVFFNFAAPSGHELGELYAFGGWSVRNGLASGAWRDPVWALDRMTSPVHPDGFLPNEKSTTEDRSLTAGLRSVMGDWDFDLGAGYGSNTFDFGARDSINASWAAGWLANQLGRHNRTLASITPAEIIANAGPMSGDSGGTELETWSVNMDVSGDISMGSNVIDAAFGAEYRWESFGIRAGDFASYGCGHPGNPGEFPAVTLVDGKVAQHDGLARCGHQGYPGYSPTSAKFSERERNSQALWADFRHDVTAAWNVETAVRWEHYEGAGNSLTGMLGNRVDVAPGVSLRGTASTGFRAPSLPQLGFNTIFFGGGNIEGGLSVNASLEDGAANRFFGLGPTSLQHETSRNISAGVVLNPWDSLTLSADVYGTEIDDRITRVEHKVDCAGADAVACGLLKSERNLPTISNVSFFDNAVDTRTVGVDIVARHDQEFMNGDLTLSGALHFNRTTITDGEDRIGPSFRTFIETAHPRQKHRVAADWTDGQLDVHLGMNYFGETTSDWLQLTPDCPGFQDISAAWIGDAAVGWRFGTLRLLVGVDNVFDQYPDEVSEACSGLLNGVLGWGLRYNMDASYGLAGRVWHARLEAKF